jgi:NTP pyrophosphatase (non-canonical NTP hydrolase)
MTRYEQGHTKEACDVHDYLMGDGHCNCRKPQNQRPLQLQIREVQAAQYEWLKEVGWADATGPLEDLALICSEVGEAVNECRGNKPTEGLGFELADIVLRTFGMAAKNGIELEDYISAKMAICRERGTRGRIK